MVSIKLIIGIVLVIGFIAAGGGEFALRNIRTAKDELGKLRDSTERTLGTERKMGEKDVG